MTDYRVATDLRGHTVVEANITCINGLRAWVMVADLGKEQPEDEMFGGFDREAIGDCIVKAMSSAPDKRVQRISDALEQAGRAAGFHSVARQFIGMAQQELRALAPGVAGTPAPTAAKPMQGLAAWLRTIAETQAADAEQEACMLQWAREVDAACGVAVPGAPSKGIYVECRECADCGHAGINDAHPTDAACNSCGWRGPSPKEDLCPSCGMDGTMTDACPKCGCGRYTFVADATVDVMVPAWPLKPCQDMGAPRVRTDGMNMGQGGNDGR